MSWRFYPLAEYPRTGILLSPDRKPVPAQFLTPEDAKKTAPQRQIEGRA